MTTQWGLPFHTWSAGDDIQLRTCDSKTPQCQVEEIYRQLDEASAQLAGEGEQATAEVTRVTKRRNTLYGRLRIEDVQAGQYSGTLSLDPLAKEAASVELTVKARHAFYWPLGLLLIGMVVGWLLTSGYRLFRRQRVLFQTLLGTARWLAFVPRPEGLYDLQGELIGEDINLSVDAAGEEEATQSTLTVLRKRIRSSFKPSSLESAAEELETVLKRIDRWSRAGRAVVSLRKNLAALPANAETPRGQTTAVLDAFGDEANVSDQVIEQANAQARVLEAFAAAWRAWVSAGQQPAGLDPRAIYGSFPSAGERSIEESRKLAARLADARARLEAPTRLLLAREPIIAGAPSDALSTDAQTPQEAEPEAPLPPWTYDPKAGFRLSPEIADSVWWLDVLVIIGYAVVAAIAFLLPIYTQTNFGSVAQYAIVFAGGVLGKVVIDRAIPPAVALIEPRATKEPEPEAASA